LYRVKRSQRVKSTAEIQDPLAAMAARQRPASAKATSGRYPRSPQAEVEARWSSALASGSEKTARAAQMGQGFGPQTSHRRAASARGRAFGTVNDRRASEGSYYAEAPPGYNYGYRSQLDNFDRARTNVSTPTWDSSNIRLVFAGVAANHDELFGRETGNSMFGVLRAPSHSVNVEAFEVPAAPAAPVPPEPAPVSPSKPQTGKPRGRRPSSARTSSRRAPSTSRPRPPADQEAKGFSRKNRAPSPPPSPRAGKPTRKFVVDMQALLQHTPRGAHPLSAPQDSPRGRGARSGVLIRDFRSSVSQDLCSTGASSVALSMLPVC